MHRIGRDGARALPDRTAASLPSETVVRAECKLTCFDVRSKSGLGKVAGRELNAVDGERCELVERAAHGTSLEGAQRDEEQSASVSQPGEKLNG
jgi:hypothetical protein